MSLARKLGALLSSGLVDPSLGGAPAGVVLPYAGTAAPAGWMLCYGQTLSRTTYAALFAAIGTAYGVGDGTTTFGLPDMRGRIPGGKDNMGGAAASRLTTAGSGVDGATLGAAGGSESHALTIPQMPSHAHSMTGFTNRNTASGGSEMIVSTGGGSTWTSTSQGSGNAHPNAQPTLVMNYIIKV